MSDDLSPQESDEIEKVVDDALSRLVRALTREKVRRSRMTGAGRMLSATDMWLLAYVSERESVRLSDLALWQAVDKSTITMQIKRLVASGLVERAVDDKDRRVARVSLTEHGCAVLAENQRQACTFLAQLIGNWTPDERAELARSVFRLADAVDASLESTPVAPAPED